MQWSVLLQQQWCRSILQPPNNPSFLPLCSRRWDDAALHGFCRRTSLLLLLLVSRGRTRWLLQMNFNNQQAEWARYTYV